LVSAGLLTPVSLGYAAARLRSTAVTVSAVLYTLAIAFVMAAGDSPPPAVDAFATVALLATWFGGTTQAFVLRRQVFAPRPDLTSNLAAEHAVTFRRALRAHARTITCNDPAQARELLIGRPDLQRTYDDGGLVDVNHAPAQAIATIPGITPATAQQIVELRETRGPFLSPEDLAMTAALDPALLPEIADYTVYLI
jgi:DNA uptake protein ComE-like DNA-binding protein